MIAEKPGSPDTQALDRVSSGVLTEDEMNRATRGVETAAEGEANGACADDHRGLVVLLGHAGKSLTARGAIIERVETNEQFAGSIPRRCAQGGFDWRIPDRRLVLGFDSRPVRFANRGSD